MTQLSRSAVSRMMHLVMVFVMILSVVGGFIYSAEAKNIYNIKADTNATTTVEGFAVDSDSDAVQQLLDQAGIEVSATDVVEVTTTNTKEDSAEEDSSAQEDSPAPSEESSSGSGAEEGTSQAEVSAAAPKKEVASQQEKAPEEEQNREDVSQAAGQSLAKAEPVSEAESSAVPSAESSRELDSHEASQTAAPEEAVATDPVDAGAYSSAESSAVSKEADKVITVTVKRPKYVTVTVDKTLTTVQLQEGDTVRDVVRRLNIVLGKNDLISQELGAVPDPSQPITINRVELSYFTKKKTEKYDTIRKPDPHSYIGTEYVKRKGVSYKKVDTYEKKIIDGGKPIITKVKTDVTEKTDQIVCYGTKVDSPSPSGLSASTRVITNRDEENKTITLSDGSTYSYYSVSDNFEATAYTGGGTTSTGRAAQVGVVAVDPSVIPYGTRMYITSGSTVYGVCVAGDTGVHGHLVDLYFKSGSQCMAFGRRGITIYFLN